MISIERKTPYKKVLAIVLGTVILILITAFTYIYAFHGTILGWPHRSTTGANTSSINTTPSTPAQVQAGNNVKKNSVNESSTGNNSKTGTGSDQPPAPTPQANGKSVVGVAITSSNQTASSLEIRTIIYSIQNNGTCTLTLTKTGEQTITETAGIQTLPSSSTCKGFDIPLSQLSKGQWTAVVNYSNDAISGSTTKTINVT